MITVEDVLRSVMVADPLHILDCSPITDGAAAVVLCPVDVARKLGKPVVNISGVGLATGEALTLNGAGIAGGGALTNGAVTAATVSGPVTLGGSASVVSNGGNIIVDGAKGKLKAHTDFGKIVIENATEVTLDLKSNGGAVEFSGSLGDGPHSVASDFGEINLTLPADSKLNVDIQTDFGKIKSDLPIAVTFSGETNTNSGDDITGTITGGGAQLTVKTNGGNVNLNAGK